MRGDSSVFCRTQMIRSAEGDECLVHPCACQLPGCFSVVAVPRTRSLCHLSLSGCLKPRLNVDYFRGFLHNSDASDKQISWGFHCSHHSTFVDWDFFFMNCVWTLCLMHVLCPSPRPPLAVPATAACLSLTCRYRCWANHSLAATSFHSFVFLHQGLYLKGIVRQCHAVML